MAKKKVETTEKVEANTVKTWADVQDMQREYAKLKVNILKGTEKNVTLLKKTRKQIARALTAINQNKTK